MSSSSSHDNDDDEAPKNPEKHIPNIEEVLNSANDNIFLNDSLTRLQKQSTSYSDEETDETKNYNQENETRDRNIHSDDNPLFTSDENKESQEAQKRKTNYHIDKKYNDIFSTPFDIFPSSNSKSYTMANPDHRYRTFCEIVLVAHHPNYLRNISDFNFIKEIGKGGYGAVWLADDMRTGNQCAVKELYVEELKGKILTSFLREIHAMIICRGKFICPIVGYTIEPPYSIITKYMPNGDLYHAVHSLEKKKKGKPRPRIYGTHLTIICMCIAHALRHIHRCGIIHRDIKPGNILIDSDGLPYLVDFGVSRLIHPDHRHSQFVGTVSHMAPEVISSTNYGTKADVFSYAILLYEVGEKRHAFHNANKHSKEVCQQILRGERPGFSADGIPSAMRNLITRCWAQNPSDRPNFDQIFQIFCEGKTYFKRSNPRKIIKFAQKLIKEDEQEIKIPPPFPPSTNMDISAVLNRLMRKLTQKGPLDKTLIELQNREKKNAADTIVEKMIQKPTILEKIINSGNPGQIPIQTDKSNTNEEKIENNSKDSESYCNSILISNVPPDPLPIFINESKDREISRNIKDPQFLEFIQFQMNKINPSQFDYLAQFIIPAISSPCNETKEILKILLKIAVKNNLFLIKYNQYHIITSVMLTDENDPYEDELFDLLGLIFVKKPLLLSQMYTRILAYFINKRPDTTICLFSSYVDNIELINDPFPILDFLLSFARVYINIPSGALFVDLFYYLISQFAEYKAQRFDTIKPIFTAFIRSDQKIVAYEAMKAICNLYDETIKINMKTLINYIRLGSKINTFSSSGSIPNFFMRASGSNLYLSSKSFSVLQERKNTNCLLLEEKMRDVSLSIIERLPQYPISNVFVQEIGLLLDLYPQKATNILLKFAHQSLECAQIIVRRTDLWMDPSRSNENSYAFNIFLEVFRYPELRNPLAEAPEFPILMSSILKNYTKTTMEALAIVFKRLTVTAQIVDSLENVGFYTQLAEICNQYIKNRYKEEQANHRAMHRSSGLELYNIPKQIEDEDQNDNNSILIKSSDDEIPKEVIKSEHHHHRHHRYTDIYRNIEVIKNVKNNHHKNSGRPPIKTSHHSKRSSESSENKEKSEESSGNLDKNNTIYSNDNESSNKSSTENNDDYDNTNISIIGKGTHSDECFDENSNLKGTLDFVHHSNQNLTNSSIQLLKRNRKGNIRENNKKRNSTYGIIDNHVSNANSGMNLRAIPVATMVIIEASSKAKYVPSFSLFISMLLNQLPLQNELTAAAIHTLTVLSFHQELKPVLNKPVLVNYFSQLKQFKAQKKYAITFLFNLLKKE
ncbi:hypothetical protein M9Y10_033802 [Tritrichomonas musculus]|uniref:Protein kinase domain-containing protein n=1 Tax=Tritrichomonas musculus TaxID=1915356 RepID=A0ABR2KD51_9EUKA